MGRRRVQAGSPNLGIGYLRASTSRQELSPQAQRQAIEEWGATNGVTVVSWHLDMGVSGRSSIEDRPELIAALADLKVHAAGVLIVARRDRLARDTLVAQLIERAVTQVGAQVMSATGVGNGDDPASMMVRSILDAVSAYEVSMTRCRIRAALQVKKAKGQRVGAVPFGWHLAEDRIHLEPVIDEQVIITQARELRAAGSTYRAVASELGCRGHRSRTGRVFDPQQIRRMVLAA